MLGTALRMYATRATVISGSRLGGPSVGSIMPVAGCLLARHCGWHLRQARPPVAGGHHLPAPLSLVSWVPRQPLSHSYTSQPPASTSAAVAAAAAAVAPEHLQRLVRSICVCTTPAQLRWLAQTETAEDRLQQAEQLPELQEHLLYNLSRYSPSDLVKLLSYLAACRAPCQDLLNEVVPLLYNTLGTLAPGELVMLLSTYISGGVYQQELFAAVSEFVYEAIPGLSAMEVSEVAWSYAVADHYDDDEDLFRALADAAVARLQDHSPESLAQLLWSLGMLRFRHDPLCAASLEQLSRQVDQWPLSSIGLALWGVAEVQHTANPEVFDRLTQNLAMRLLSYRTSTQGQQLGVSVGGVIRSTGAAATTAQAVTTRLPLLRIGRQTSMTPGGGNGTGSRRDSSSYTAEGEDASSGINYAQVETPFIGYSTEAWPSDATTTSSSSDGAPTHEMERTVVPRGPIVAAFDAGAPGGNPGGPAAPVGADSSSSSSSSQGPPMDANGAPLRPPMRRTAMMQAAIMAAGSPEDICRVVKVRVPSTLLAGYELVEIPALITNSIPFSSMLDSAPLVPEVELEATVSLSSSSSSSTIAVDAAVLDFEQQRGFSTSAQAAEPAEGSSDGPVPTPAPTTASSGSKQAPWSSWGRSPAEPVEVLPGALVRTVWACAMLARKAITSAVFRECFALLGLFDRESFADGQLTLMWVAHMRVRELNHPLREAPPNLADNIKVYTAKISRVAPGNLGLHTLQQPLAAACWLASSLHPDTRSRSFSSWRYRNPAVLSHTGMVQSVLQALHRVPEVAHPLQQVTLDGIYQLPLLCKARGASIAWEVLPPGSCCRNAPHGATAAAAARAKGLEYRGYKVVQVPFWEWSDALEAADPAAATVEYLQRKLDERMPPQPAPAAA